MISLASEKVRIEGVECPLLYMSKNNCSPSLNICYLVYQNQGLLLGILMSLPKEWIFTSYFLPRDLQWGMGFSTVSHSQNSMKMNVVWVTKYVSKSLNSWRVWAVYKNFPTLVFRVLSCALICECLWYPMRRQYVPLAVFGDSGQSELILCFLLA